MPGQQPAKIIMNNGYIMLQRRFFSHWLWEENRSFSKAEAFLDLLQLAAFAPTKRVISGSLIELDEGEIVASVRYLSARWTWGKDKVAVFMKLLESDGIIRRATRQRETVITLCNYKDYNGRQDGGPDVKPDRCQTVTRQRPDKVEEGEKGEEGKTNTPLPPNDYPPLCSLPQAIEVGRLLKISDRAVEVWWHTRNASDWTKGVAGGGASRKITNWRSDLQRSQTWAEEQACKENQSASTGTAVIGGRTFKL